MFLTAKSLRNRPRWRVLAITAFVGSTAPPALAQSITILNVQNTFFPGPGILIEWRKDCNCTNNAGGAEAVFDGGAHVRAIIDDVIGPCGDVHFSQLQTDGLFGGAFVCGHTLELRGRVSAGSGSCDQDLVDVTSNAVTVWLDDPGTPQPENMANCTKGPPGCNRSAVGNPVDVASGKMYHELTDLEIQGPLPIKVARRYDSQSTFNGPVGYGWQHNYQMRLEFFGHPVYMVLTDKEMRRIYFDCSNFASGTCQQAWHGNNVDHLELAENGDGTWTVTDKHNTRHDFDTLANGGRLLGITDRSGNTLTFAYSGSNLTSITDAFGRSMTLAYSGGKLQSVSAGTRMVTYVHTGDDLTRVNYPDGSFVTYEYTAHNMTAAKDAVGNVIESHTYDGSDRVTHTESEGGNDAYTLEYDTPAAGQTRVTNGRGVATVYTLDTQKGVVTNRTGGPGCSSCGDGGNSTQTTYDGTLNVTAITDGVGVSSQMTYDDRGNVLTRTDALGTPGERTGGVAFFL